jgi:hypothetical protein
MTLAGKADPEEKVAQLLVLDFDGVVHEHDHWEPHFGRVDATLIHMAHASGHVVAIVTGNKPGKVARALHAQNVRTRTDPLMRRRSWDGGRDGRTVLVTHRKLDGTRLFVDDRALCWRYGDNPLLVMAALEAALAQRPVI